MSRVSAILLLVLAALLEAGGDALIRHGLRAHTNEGRAAWFALGAIVLFAYGYGVSAAPWDFGKLLGLYVVFFFVAAQVVSTLFFKQPPSGAVLLGGAFIVAGGLVISFG